MRECVVQKTDLGLPLVKVVKVKTKPWKWRKATLFFPTARRNQTQVVDCIKSVCFKREAEIDCTIDKAIKIAWRSGLKLETFTSSRTDHHLVSGLSGKLRCFHKCHLIYRTRTNRQTNYFMQKIMYWVDRKRKNEENMYVCNFQANFGEYKLPLDYLFLFRPSSHSIRRVETIISQNCKTIKQFRIRFWWGTVLLRKFTEYVYKTYSFKSMSL